LRETGFATGLLAAFFTGDFGDFGDRGEAAETDLASGLAWPAMKLPISRWKFGKTTTRAVCWLCFERVVKTSFRGIKN
jgi:hypothetical protein